MNPRERKDAIEDNLERLLLDGTLTAKEYDATRWILNNNNWTLDQRCIVTNDLRSKLIECVPLLR